MGLRPDDQHITTYGETEDYTVIIVEALMGLNDNNILLTPIIYKPYTRQNNGRFKKYLQDISVKLNDILGRELFSKSYAQSVWN